MAKFRGNVGDLVPAALVDDILGALLPTDEGRPASRSVARLARALLDLGERASDESFR